MNSSINTLIKLLLVLISISLCTGCSRNDPLETNSETSTILAFIQDEEKKEALTAFSEDSLNITKVHKYSQYYYDYYSDGTPAYYYSKNGVIETNSTMLIADNTEIVADFRELYPGLFVWVIHNYSDSGVTGVFFSNVKRSDIDAGQFDQENLIYIKDLDYSLTELGFEELGDGWYYELIQLPSTTHEPNS
jgi:hypothetical protein